MTGLWKDYNKPLTELEYYYDGYSVWGEQNTRVVPGWLPSGSLADLKFWLSNNSNYPYRFGQSGILPDGTISHHVSNRQDTALHAYGYEWHATTPFDVANLLNRLDDANLHVEDKMYNDAIEVLMFTYKPFIYRGALDFQVSGRSYLSPNNPIFASKKYSKDVTELLDSASNFQTIDNSEEIRSFVYDLENENHTLSGSFNFWNSETLVQRQENSASDGWYGSFSTQSARHRGAESFNNEPGLHNGSGVLLVRGCFEGQISCDNPYGEVLRDFDWHLLPGITEEWRDDNEIPMPSEQNKFNPNHFAGNLSDGEYGLGSFHYASDNTYTAAQAKKSVFFMKDRVLALGTDVTRVTGRGQDIESAPYATPTKEIITVVDQRNWTGDLHYHNGEKLRKLSQGTDHSTGMGVHSDAWFHQDNMGYFLKQSDGYKLRTKIVTGNMVNDTLPNDNTDSEVFWFGFNHTAEPDKDNRSYHYITMPNIQLDDMGAMSTLIDTQMDVVNLSSVQGHHFVEDVADLGSLEVIQMVFHEAGAYTFSMHSGNNSERSPITVSAAKPALVQFVKTTNGWRLTVSDPTFHVDEAASNALSDFGVVLKPEENIISIGFSEKLVSGIYQYNLQGLHAADSNRHALANVVSQKIVVDANGDGSAIAVHLPDDTDGEDYGNRQQLYAGMSASKEIPSLP